MLINASAAKPERVFKKLRRCDGKKATGGRMVLILICQSADSPAAPEVGAKVSPLGQVAAEAGSSLVTDDEQALRSLTGMNLVPQHFGNVASH